MLNPAPAGTATFTIQNDWQTGFTGQVTITNTGTTAVTGWQIELDTIDQMTASWNGTIVSQSPGKYVVSNAAWNGSLAPGASATFGFNLNRAPGNTGVGVFLTSFGGAAIVPPPAPLPVLQVTTASVNEGAPGSHQESFDVRLSAASTQAVTVQYATANGTAVAGRDYDAAAGQITFAPGQTDQTILVGTHPGAAGTNLAFSLVFSNAVGATAPSAAATGQIINPAAVVPPPPGVLSVNVSEDAYQGDAQFSVAVDGKQVGGTYTATASHAAGQSASVMIAGSFGTGPHSVTITFLNDAYGGPGLDRNLYVNAITYNGATQAVGAGLYTSNASTTVSVGAAALPPTAGSGFQYLGVNLSGAEFGIPNPTAGTVNIGTYGIDYTYPTHGELDYYASEHLNVIRLPFSWERLEPVQNGALDSTQLGYIDDVVHYAASKGISVVLDPHNYGYGYGNLIGSAATPDASFDKLWSQLAAHYANQSNVIFGLMNEPHVQTPAQWVQPVNDAIASIRAAGATQEILVPGTDYTGGSSWVTSGNAAIFAANIVDPGHKMAFEIHQYSDADGSGSSTAVVSPTIGADRLQAVTAWAEQTGNKLFLGEFGAGQDAASITNLTNMLSFMQQHTDVWQGGTEWGGGPWWGSYGFATDPVSGTTTPQVATLATFAPKGGGF